jgi:hypothetical protein
VLAVDLAKAFDTLAHEYIKAVFRFFGFDVNLIKWLNLLGHQRQACIELEHKEITFRLIYLILRTAFNF